MRTRPLLAGLLLIAATTMLYPAPAAAGQEVTFVLGAMIGDSLGDVLQVRPSSLTEGFDDAPIFGARLGWSAFPFALEGSLLYSPSAIRIGNVGSLDADIVYAEAELQLIILPGPIAPYLGAGIGIHSIRLDAGAVPRETTTGYVFGGGLKAAIGTLGLRVDLKDHITPLQFEELSPAFLQFVGIAEDTNVHNIEFSAGVTIRF
jgi:hypothetical protein